VRIEVTYSAAQREFRPPDNEHIFENDSKIPYRFYIISEIIAFFKAKKHPAFCGQGVVYLIVYI